MDMTLQERIDEVFDLRQERLAIQKKVDMMKAKEDGLVAALATEMEELELQEVRGEHGKLKLSMAENAEVTSYPDLYAYIKETGSFDLLQRRVSLTGVRERWQEGNEVPGVARVLETKATLGKA